MLQTTRTRFVAPGRAVAADADPLARLRRLAFAPLTDLPMTDLPSDVDRLVASVLRADTAPAASPPAPWAPAVDVEEHAEGLRLAFEVPGIAPEALEVTVHDRVLTVSGERAATRRVADPGRSASRLERQVGRFSRSITLPETIDPERITAHYEHGVLYLDLAKRPEARPRRIEISARSTSAEERSPDRPAELTAGDAAPPERTAS